MLISFALPYSSSHKNKNALKVFLSFEDSTADNASDIHTGTMSVYFLNFYSYVIYMQKYPSNSAADVI